VVSCCVLRSLSSCRQRSSKVVSLVFMVTIVLIRVGSDNSDIIAGAGPVLPVVVLLSAIRLPPIVIKATCSEIGRRIVIPAGIRI